MDRMEQGSAACRPLEERSVAEVMTKDLLTISPTESVLMAWELMHRQQCHHLPVVDDEGHCLGVLDAQTVAVTWETGGPDRARRPVTALLAERSPSTVGPGDGVRAAAQTMLRSNTDHVAATDQHGRLVGLLTAHDLIAALAGITRSAGAERTAMPSLYRVEAVLPGRPQDHHDRRSQISPE
ncbi:MAG: CBS domain-containing protein [Actinomadura sp.]